MQITRLHYFPFTIDTAVPWSEATIQSKTFEVNLHEVAPRVVNLVLGALTLRLCRGRFEPRIIKMRAELDNGKKVLLVDGSGCVRLGSVDYFMYPRNLLFTEEKMHRIMITQNPNFPNPSG